jgi:phage terminase small subunit
MDEEPTYDQKVEKFIALYVASGNASKAAREAGWAANRSSRTGYELLQKPEILSRIRELQQLEHKTLLDSEGSIDSTVENMLPKALKTLAANMDDPKVAQQVWALAERHFNNKEQKFGEFEGMSTGEVIKSLDVAIAECQTLKERIMEALRTGEMSEEPVVL